MGRDADACRACRQQLHIFLLAQYLYKCKKLSFYNNVRPIIDTYKTAKILSVTSRAVDITHSSYYIHSLWHDRLIFCCFMCQLWALHVVKKRTVFYIYICSFSTKFILKSEWSRRSNCVTVLNFVKNCSNCGRDMAIFQNDGCCHLGFLKLQMFNGLTRHECQTVSVCQILWRSAKTLPRYHSFWIFQDGRHQEGQTASLCLTSSKSLKPRLRYGDFFIFQDGGRRHLGF